MGGWQFEGLWFVCGQVFWCFLVFVVGGFMVGVWEDHDLEDEIWKVGGMEFPMKESTIFVQYSVCLQARLNAYSCQNNKVLHHQLFVGYITITSHMSS